ncbi:MAG TPA: LCP family protein [Streptosporangiaceae bacterium]|jgi:LCP family protein required for cell wall assembly
MASIAAGRRARQQRALLLVFAAMSALVLMVAGSTWALTSYVGHSLRRVSAGTTGTPAGGPLNILVAGVDLRSGLTRRQQLQLHVGRDISTNSDTLMIVHVAADSSRVQVVSLPRDSWVDIPGHGMNKINAAFGLGGPALLVQTVQQATGLTINDFVEVNFLGFVKVIDALGGVRICLPYAVADPDSGLRLSAGPHHVDGITALEFARDRHSFALSDLARISDQQQLMSSMLKEAISSGTLTNPLKLSHFLSSALQAVQVDRGLNPARLAGRLRGIRPADVSFSTVPLANVNYRTPTGEDAVLWNASAAARLFASLKDDQVPARPAHRKPSVSRSQVSVDVYNGTTISGLSAQTGSELARLGFTVHGDGLDWPGHDIRATEIDYPAGQQAAAELLGRVMPGAVLHQEPGLVRLRILLGHDGSQVTVHGGSAAAGRGGAGGTAGSGAAGSPAGTGTKTAAQAACR